jgi:hypothetical protein
MTFVLFVGLIDRLGEVAQTTICRSCSVCKTYFSYRIKRQLQMYLSTNILAAV